MRLMYLHTWSEKGSIKSLFCKIRGKDRRAQIKKVQVTEVEEKYKSNSDLNTNVSYCLR